MKKILWIVMLLFCVGFVNAMDLSDYPSMFISGDSFDGIVVVSDNAAAEDVIATSDIINSLQFRTESSGRSTTMSRIEVGVAKLASQVSDYNAQNMILVGRSMIRDPSQGNPIIDRFYTGNPSGGLIKLIQNGAYYVVIVTGDDVQSTREAANVLSNYKDYNLDGIEYWIDNDEPEPLCTDSDDGKDYYERGKGVGSYGNDEEIGVIWGEDSNICTARFDPNLGYSIHYDCCSDATGNNQLNEAYCDENGILRATSYQCPHGCRHGACLRSPLDCDYKDVIEEGKYKTITINDVSYEVFIAIISDSTNPYVKLIVNGENTGYLYEGREYELASGLKLKVLSIIPNEAGDVTQDLVEVCFSAASHPGCVDSDGGRDLYEAGEARGSDGRGASDYCDFMQSEKGILHEAVCIDGAASFAEITCPSSAPYCNKGVCSKQKPACTDTDGGENIFVKGTITEPRNSDGPKHTDYCENINTKRAMDSCEGSACGIREYYCSSPYRTTSYKDIRCPNGCSDGVCLGGNLELPPFLVGVYDKADASDVILATDLVVELQKQGYAVPPETTKLFSEINAFYLDNQVTVAIFEGSAIIIVGESSPSDHVFFATKVAQVLKGNGVGSKSIISSEIVSSNLIDLFDVPEGKYVKLDEKFELSDGQSAKVTDHGYMKIILESITTACATSSGCSSRADMLVQMLSDCEEECDEATGICSSCSEGSRIRIRLEEGESRSVFGANLSFLDEDDGEGIFIVQKGQSAEYVDIEIYPVEETVSYGEKAVYKVTVKDKHRQMVCEEGTTCSQRLYNYLIDVSNLPFMKDYPKRIDVAAGQSTSFELTVNPYVVEEQIDEAAQEKTATSSSRGSSATGYSIAKNVRSASARKAVVEEGGSSSETATRYYRTYKFSIRAKEKNSPGNQDIDYAVLNIKPETPPNPPPFPGEEIEIKLDMGWNLISLPGKLIRFEKIGTANKLVGFVYLKEEQRYVSMKEAEQILGEGIKEYLAKNAFWVYSYQYTSLRVKVDREISYNDIMLKRGWNLVPVTEDMIGGYLKDISGDCEFEKLNLWESRSQSWKSIDEDYLFSERLLNYGFLVKVEEDCRLSGAIIALKPPAMPE